jgi:pimeloyl-ACP methyl ester carboxylesterase
MIKYNLLILISILTINTSLAQDKKYTPRIEECDCRFAVDPEFLKNVPEAFKGAFAQPVAKIDSSFKTKCGYLIVPENRNKKNSNMIKLPFIIVKSKNPNKKSDPILFTSGGPGNSSLNWATGVTRNLLIEDRDCIAFEQRGTRFAIPYIRSFDLDNAIKEAYRKNLSKDSMTIVGLKNYKKSLEARHIDISGYNTDETVSDIHDLLSTLKIDSVNLFGVSYSGGLMTAVLQRYPSRIRSLMLDSPLPSFIPIDEDEPANFNEALDVLFRHVEKDSLNKALYGNLKQNFQHYFTSIKDKTFYIPYLEAGTKDSIKIAYTKNELIGTLVNTMYDDSNRKNIPFMINDMIQGNHKPYVNNFLDELFKRNSAPDGMRISVYCADQAAYHSEKILKEMYNVYPYMEGYHINDVYKEMCDCWKVPPIKKETKQGFYSTKPILLADGEMDPACRPVYIDLIAHYMPNSQRFLLLQRAHGVIGRDMAGIIRSFLDDPYKKIGSDNKNIIAY